jgi:protein ImuB
MPRILSLWLPRWPTDRRMRTRSQGRTPPDPPGAPLVLAERRGNRLEIAAVSAAAEALGLSAGEPLASARARIPTLLVETLDAAGDRRALDRLARWAQARISPLVAPDPPHGLWIETAGACHIFGGEARMCERLIARLDAWGITARAALADTPGAAHALARFAADARSIVPVHATAEALAPLPVAALRLARQDVEALVRLGITSISDLLALPRAALGRRFGLPVLKRLDQALGRAGEPLGYLPHDERLAASIALPEPLATPEALHGLIERLVPLLIQKLLHAGEGALRLDLLFNRLDGSVAAVRAGASAPTRDRAHIARLLHLLVEGVDPGFGIERATLACPHAAPLAPHQLGTASSSTTAAETVDRLIARLGPGRVFAVTPRAGAFPEAAVRRSRALATTGSGWPRHLPRPTRLFDPPERVDAIAMLPDRPPAAFRWRGRRHRVLGADGPERMHAAWWEPGADAAAVRDYFIVEVEDGLRLWLFRAGDGEDPASGDFGWRVHGLFGA